MTRPNIILLHGALGSEKDFTVLKEKLNSVAKVKNLTFSGHSYKSGTDVNYSIETFTLDLKSTIDELEGDCYLFGYSLGGYVALNYQRIFGDNSPVKGIICLATKFHWAEKVANKEASKMNPAMLKEKNIEFVNKLKIHHNGNWERVVPGTGNFMRELGRNNVLMKYSLNLIQVPVRLWRGEQDKMVTAGETRLMAEKLANCKYEEIKDWPHPIEKVATEHLSIKIKSEIENFSQNIEA